MARKPPPKKPWQEEQPAKFADPGPTQVLWRPNQVTYGLHPSEIKLGMMLGYLEHASLECYAEKVPKEARFVLGKVTMLKDDLMTITWVAPPKGFGLSMTCGVEYHARYCIRAGKR